MIFLVDANVLSEPTRPSPNQKVVEWLDKNESRLVVDPIILGEVGIGILGLAAGRKRAQLEKWFARLVQTIECIPWDAAVSRRWATLVVGLKREGKIVPILDAMIAATALEHDLTIATRNVRDFKVTRAKVFDPFG